MQASVLTRVETLEEQTIDRPTPAAGDVLVEVGACGVCMTDYHIYSGSFSADLPLVLGHESAGRIVERGEDVTSVDVGDRVAICPAVPCYTCSQCKAGRTNLCDDLLAIGAAGDEIKDGAFAEYVTVPARAVEPIADLPYRRAAFAEPLACCVHGVDRVDPLTGESVAIIGAGPIGLLLVQTFRERGAGPVVVSEPIDARRELALEFGAAEAVDPTACDPIRRVGELVGEVDVAVEAVGAVDTIRQARELTAKGGTTLIFGVPPEDETVPISPFDVFYREQTILGSFASTPGTMERAVSTLHEDWFETDPLITGEFDLGGLPRALGRMGRAEGLKKIIYPSGVNDG